MNQSFNIMRALRFQQTIFKRLRLSVQTVLLTRSQRQSSNFAILSILFFGILVTALHILVNIFQYGPTVQLRESFYKFHFAALKKYPLTTAGKVGKQTTSDILKKTSVEENIPSMNEFTDDADKFAIEVYEYHTLENYLICRLKHACLDKNGTLFLHSDLRASNSIIRKCSIKNFKFYSANQVNNSNDGISQKETGLNLIGLEPTAYHMPHFLTDVLPAVLAVHSNSISNLSATSTCIPANKTCRLPKLLSLEHKQTALLVSRRVEQMDETSWVKQFSLKVFGGHQIMLLSYQTMFQIYSQNIICFKSVTTYNKERLRFIDASWFRRLPFTDFSNQVVRSFPRRSVKPNCERRIIVINRKPEEERNLIDANRLKLLIEQNVNHMWLKTEVSVVLFHNLSFHMQASLMKTAHVIIGVHGAALSNIVFARQGTVLIEILPFTYYAGPFVDIARSFELKYSSIIANPDTQAFQNCLNSYKDKLKDSSILTAGMAFWNKAIRNDHHNNKSINREFNVFYSKGHYSSFLRICARRQRLQTDLITLSAIAIEKAAQTCMV